MIESPELMKPFNLFTYGTLMNPSVFRAVLGLRLASYQEQADGIEAFLPREAVLNGYKTVSPDHTYLYAVPDPHGRIRGYVVGPLPGNCMSALRTFEGSNYIRRRMAVHTEDGEEIAVVFLGHIDHMGHAFGYPFHDTLKQEILLEGKIDQALRESELKYLHTDETPYHRAVGELHGPIIRDIVRRHFDAGGISDYAINRMIKEEPLQDFSRIANDEAAKTFAPHYLAMVIRQVIFNQIEDNVRHQFRYELDHLGWQSQYYERTVSSLAGLRMLNARPKTITSVVDECLNDLSFPDNHLVDFVRRGVLASDAFYDQKAARQQIEYVRNHMGRGATPLGAELEFSNIGHDVIRDPQARMVRDSQYDGFLYFYDFALDALTWKLGGHIDDHRKKSTAEPRRGFFEVALGNLSVSANISKPVTNDPWILNQLVHEIRRFYLIKPHSIHISMQLRTRQQPVRDRLLPLSIMKCLFAVAGDPCLDEQGKLTIKRLAGDEITTRDPVPVLMFSQISRRRSVIEDDGLATAGRSAGKFVQQFKFLRLSPETNYEPIVMALKGVQLNLKPGSFLTGKNYEAFRLHREMYEQLMTWGQSPRQISRGDIRDFTSAIAQGLTGEHRGRPAHSDAYIAWALGQLDTMLTNFNALVAKSRKKTKRHSRK